MLNNSARFWEMVAPASVYSASVNPAPAPMPASTTTSAPMPHSFLACAGVIGIRFSPGCVSFGMAMRMRCLPPYLYLFDLSVIGHRFC